MPIPHPNITPIPNNEPDAVPGLWNVRYEEIDQNFQNLEERTAGNEQELAGARGGKANLGERLTEMAGQLNQMSPEFQDVLAAMAAMALDQAGVANHSVEALKRHIQQEGEITLRNRGVVSGCTCVKSTTATRNLNLTGGQVFMNGRMYRAPDATNAASVPPNTGAGNVTVRAYLYFHSGSQTMRLAVTNIGEELPTGAIHLYNVTIPPNSTDATDPQLTNVTLTSVRRVEASYPRAINNPVAHTVAIEALSKADYRLDVDVVSFSGGHCSPDQVLVSSRATNGFTLELASEVDNVVLRWRVSKLNN